MVCSPLQNSPKKWSSPYFTLCPQGAFAQEVTHLKTYDNFHRPWAPGLALKRRPKVIRKWAISAYSTYYLKSDDELDSEYIKKTLSRKSWSYKPHTELTCGNFFCSFRSRLICFCLYTGAIDPQFHMKKPWREVTMKHLLPNQLREIYKPRCRWDLLERHISR